MPLLKSKKIELEKKFQKVLQSPEGFGFFEAVHDFIEHIEATPALSSGISRPSKANREFNIGTKYGHLLQIYQGVEDVDLKSPDDLGHARLVNVRDLTRIRNSEFSENNYFWKKRALFKKLAAEVYERLAADQPMKS